MAADVTLFHGKLNGVDYVDLLQILEYRKQAKTKIKQILRL